MSYENVANERKKNRKNKRKIKIIYELIASVIFWVSKIFF